MNNIRGIGIRCTPNEVFFTVSESSTEEIRLLVVDFLIVPIALQTPEKLKFIRNTLLDVFDEYSVNRACIRIPESTAQSTNIDRTNLEAVIQELIASSSVDNYYIGQISSISSKLQFQRTDFKKYISGEIDYPSVNNWNGFNSNEKESILASLSTLNL